MPSFVSVLKSVAGSLTPKDNDDYVPVRALPQKKTRFGFSKVINNGIDSDFGTLIAPLGTGMAVSQSAANLVLTTGVNIRQDCIIRSNFTVTDPFTLRWSSVLSQRIINQQFIVELVDVLGDGLATVINSATSVSITIPNHPFTSQNIGQSVTLGNYAGTGTFIPGSNAVIQAVAGDVVTFTVAGFAAGSGTCSVFGWNYHRFTYEGATATTMFYRSQRNGWPSTQLTVTTNTTASPGHIGVYNVEDNIAAIFDQLRSSASVAQTTSRGNAIQDLPPNDTPLYLQIRVVNGTTAPASSTTWSISFVDIDNYVPQQVSVTSARSQSMQSGGIPVTLQAAVSATVTPFNSTMLTLVTAATLNPTVVAAASASRKLHEITASNPTTTPVFLKVYNKATAPVVATDVPVMTIPVPADSFVSWSAPFGKMLTGGIVLGVTGGIAAADATNAVAGVQIHGSYQ